jgi:hypothetical protein
MNAAAATTLPRAILHPVPGSTKRPGSMVGPSAESSGILVMVGGLASMADALSNPGTDEIFGVVFELQFEQIHPSALLKSWEM